MKISTKVYPKSLILSLIFVLYVVQIALQNKISILSKYDEICAIMSYVYLIWMFFNNRLSDFTRNGLVIILFIALVGALGNVCWEVQTNAKAITTDLGGMFKVYTAFFASYEFFRTNKNSYRVQQYLNTFCVMFVVPGFFLAILNLFVDIGMYTEYVYGIRAFNYVLNRVGSLNVACVACLIVMIAQLNNIDEKKQLKQKIYIFMAIVLLLSTLRTRAFAFVIFYIVGYFGFVKGKKIKIKWIYALPMIITIVYIAYPKIRFYFGESTDAARGVLLRCGIRTALTYFPLGAGFGSYGTFAAREYWSKLYNRYRFENYFGMSKENGDFLTDNYWPAIAGEFGVIGVLLMVSLLVVIYRIVLKETKNRNVIRFASLFGLICVTMASAVSSSFLHYTNMLTLSLVGMQLSNRSIIQRDQ